MTKRRGNTTKRPGPSRWTRTAYRRRTRRLATLTACFSSSRSTTPVTTLTRSRTSPGRRRKSSSKSTSSMRPPGNPIRPAPNCTPWDGRSTRSGPRTSGPCASSSSFSATWVWREAASMPCAARAMCRGPQTTGSCSTPSPGTSRRPRAPWRTLNPILKNIRRRPRTRRA